MAGLVAAVIGDQTAGADMTEVTRLAAGLMLTAVAALAAGTQVWAQTYPDRLARYIVPGSPGSGADILARIVGGGLSQLSGQQVVVENRTGAGGNIGAEIAAKAPADGYTVFLASATHGINPGLQKKLPYDSIRDFAPITLVASSPLVFVANPSLGVTGIKELVAAAKAQPGRINYASSGPGTGGHLAVELLSWMAGITLTHVPYKGAGPALVDLIGGQV